MFDRKDQDFVKVSTRTLRMSFYCFPRSVYDIDLYAGGICEPAVPGGAVGDTFANIIANQFADLKYGDRWFFTHRQKPQGFNDGMSRH